MMKVVGLLFSTLFATSLAKGSENLAFYVPTHPRTDNSTFANLDHIRDYHVHIDWDDIYWDSSTILGSITHDMNVLQDTNYITFDIWDLDILNVTDISAGSASIASKNGHKVIAGLGATELTFSIKTVAESWGQVLVIETE